METEKLKQEINTRLWYALGDIEPTDEKMTRAVESVYNLLVEEYRRGFNDCLKEQRIDDVSRYL